MSDQELIVIGQRRLWNLLTTTEQYHALLDTIKLYVEYSKGINCSPDTKYLYKDMLNLYQKHFSDIIFPTHIVPLLNNIIK